MEISLNLLNAFDTISHEMLLEKLYHIGIREIALKWFESYLTNRQHHTEYDTALSNVGDICQRVPQGSILGPLSGLHNDFHNCLVRADSKMYANDTNIFISNKCFQQYFHQ